MIEAAGDLAAEELRKLSDDPDGWLNWYRGLTPDQKAEIQESLKQTPRIGPQPGPQTMAFNSEAQVTGYGGAAGGGKAQTNQSLTQTPYGPAEIGSLKPGARICDACGGTQAVIGVRDWEKWPVWRVTFSDGTHIDCAPEHEWTGWWSHRGRQVWMDGKRVRLCGEEGAVKLETRHIQKKMAENPEFNRFRVPLAKPATGNYNKYKIDPYTLGVIIGDGCTVGGKVKIGMAEADRQVLEAVQIAHGGELKLIERDENHKDILQLNLNDEVRESLRALDLAECYAWEKFLPESSFWTSLDWRWSLMRGLMDTDGWVEEKRCAYYTTTSKQLAVDIARLARSLGCFATTTEKNPTYTHKGEKLNGRPAWSIRIKSATPDKLFHLDRKREIAERLEHQSLSKEIVSIEDLGKREDMRCIHVSNPNGLYLADDYTVTHNSALIAMLALTRQTRSVIFRKEGKQMRALVDEIANFAGTTAGLNRAAGVFYLPDRPGHLIEWGGIGNPGEEQSWRGRPHDGFFVDEATEVMEAKIRFLMAWMRTTDPEQRCRALLTFNPPGGPEDTTGSQGRWVIRYFAPWLDERYENRAVSGEIRHFITDRQGNDVEVDGPEPREVELEGGQKFMMNPQSRTFIFARVSDNKYLAKQGYEDTLLSLQEPERSRMYLGDFSSGICDHDFQMIPTRWVDAAMDRWVKAEQDGRLDDYREQEMGSMGIDVAMGGRDFTVLARRHGWFWDELIKVQGKDVPDGYAVAALCMGNVRDGATLCIDAVSLNSPYDILKRESRMKVVGVKGQARRNLPHVSKGQECRNMRTALYWMLRKILDPANNLHPLLPADDRLRSELLTPQYDRSSGIIEMERKEDVIKRVGYSTDDADAVVYSLACLDDIQDLTRVLEGHSTVDRAKLYGPRPAAGGPHNWMSM